jgi:hypothetical protein
MEKAEHCKTGTESVEPQEDRRIKQVIFKRQGNEVRRLSNHNVINGPVGDWNELRR